MQIGFKIDNDADESIYKLFKRGKIVLAWDPKRKDLLIHPVENPQSKQDVDMSNEKQDSMPDNNR